MGHIDIQYQQIKTGGSHFFDHRLSIFGFIDHHVADTAIDQ
jgi:hypothetical protein